MHRITMRIPPRCLAALAAGLLSLPTAALCDKVPSNAKTLARLQQFVTVERAFQDSPLGLEAGDRQAWLACDRLSRRTRDNELSDVEAFAVRPEAKEVRWLLAGVLIQRNRFDAAARVFVCALTEDPDNRKCRMWKWWDYHFSKRADFKEMNRKIAEGFLRQFERGTAEERMVIAEVFGKGRPEAEMNAGDFRKAIGLPERK